MVRNAVLLSHADAILVLLVAGRGNQIRISELMVAALVAARWVGSTHFLHRKVRAVLRAQPVHLGMHVGRLLVFGVHGPKFHICLCIGLILHRMVIRRRYLMIHVVLVRGMLLLILALSVVLAITSLIQVYFLRELSVQFLLAGHLTVVICAHSMCSVNLSWWYWCKVDLVLVIHFNSSD